MRVHRHLHTDFQTVTSALKPVVRSIRTTTAGFIFMVALVALSAAFSMMPRQVLAEETEDPGDIVVRYLDPAKVFLYNADAELSSTDEIVVATLKYSWPKRHRLVIDFSSVGAITQSTMTSALLYLGCDVDGTACIGTQSNPPRRSSRLGQCVELRDFGRPGAQWVLRTMGQPCRLRLVQSKHRSWYTQGSSKGKCRICPFCRRYWTR